MALTSSCSWEFPQVPGEFPLLLGLLYSVSFSCLLSEVVHLALLCIAVVIATHIHVCLVLPPLGGEFSGRHLGPRSGAPFE